MSAPMAEYTVNWIVVQNASKIWLWYLLNSSTSASDRLLVKRRRRRRGDAGRAQVLVERRLPRAVLLHLRERVVDLGPQVGVALLQADAVALLGKRLAHDLESAGALRRVARQDYLIGGHCVDRAVLQRLDAGRIGVVLLQLNTGVLVLDALGGRGTRHRAQLLVVLQRLGAGDIRVVRLHQQALPGDQVRPREVDLLLAGIGDRIGGGDELDLVVLDQRLTLPGRGFLPLDLVLVEPELLGDILRDVDVETTHGAVRVLQSEPGLVELGADDDRVASATTTTTAAAARGRRARQCDGECDGRCDSHLEGRHVRFLSPARFSA